MAKNTQIMWSFVVGAILVLGILAFAGVISTPFSTVDKSVDTQKLDDGTALMCTGDVTPQLNEKAYDIKNKGTALTEATNIYRKVGEVTWSTFTAGTPFPNSGSLEPGAKYEIVMGITTSDFTDNAYGKYFVTDPIKCQEIISESQPMYNDEVETSVSATFYNEDGNADAQTFTAGQSKTVTLKFQAGVDEVFGNPFIKESSLSDNGRHSKEYPNVLCFQLNSSECDKPQKVSVNGVEMDSVPTPQRLSTTTDFISYCYEAPVIDDTRMSIQVTLKADDTNAPTVDGTAYYYAGNFYVDEDGNVQWGVEDEEGNAVGTDAPVSLTLDFTA